MVIMRKTLRRRRSKKREKAAKYEKLLRSMHQHKTPSIVCRFGLFKPAHEPIKAHAGAHRILDKQDALV